MNHCSNNHRLSNMRLRNDAVGADQTCHFNRLLAELWSMIWRLTLQPRLVEVECQWLDEDERPYYYSRAAVPVAFHVCHDSVDAVAPLYPRYFLGLHSHGVLFNPSLDTLYLEDFYDDHLLDFVKSLSDKEAPNLEKIAISENAGIEVHFYDVREYGFWKTAVKALQGLSKLRSILIVNDPYQYLQSYSSDHTSPGENHDLLMQFLRDWREDSSCRCAELFNEFPDALAQRFNLNMEGIPEARLASASQLDDKHALLVDLFNPLRKRLGPAHQDPDPELQSLQEWLDKRIGALWGW